MRITLKKKIRYLEVRKQRRVTNVTFITKETSSHLSSTACLFYVCRCESQREKKSQKRIGQPSSMADIDVPLDSS